ncbi:unnamed protein product [Discosporangium mesarthrocarpum]
MQAEEDSRLGRGMRERKKTKNQPRMFAEADEQSDGPMGGGAEDHDEDYIEPVQALDRRSPRAGYMEREGRRGRRRTGEVQSGSADFKALVTPEGVKQVVKGVLKFGIPGGDWGPVMSSLKLTQLGIPSEQRDNVDAAKPYLQAAIDSLDEVKYREVASRVAVMELIHQKLVECPEGHIFFIKDALSRMYQMPASEGVGEWSLELDRKLLQALVDHGNNVSAILKDDTLGFMPAVRALLHDGELAEAKYGRATKLSPEARFIKKRISVLEKALLDEYHYKLGRQILPKELDDILTRDLQEVEKNDKELDGLIKEAKQSKEQKIPSLVTMVADMDKFLSAGEDVIASRKQVLTVRKKLAEAFTSMRTFMQNYQCKDEEFDLGMTLMNPMERCGSLVGFP